MVDRARAIGREIAACRACADDFAATRTGHAPRPVLQIAPNAPICIASQAPGRRAHAAGRPFHDPSGVRLRAWLGLEPVDFYDPTKVAILPMAFCFPGHDAKGGDRPPPKRCAALWRERLFAVHGAFKLVLLVGAAAQRWHLGAAARPTLTETVRDWRSIYDGDRAEPRLLPLPHPSWRNTAWLARNPWFEAELAPFVRACVADALTRR